MKQLEELAARMKQVNLSELARRCNMARPHITDIAHGRVQNMRISTYAKLVEALDEMESPALASCEDCLSISSGEATKCGYCGGHKLESF